LARAWREPSNYTRSRTFSNSFVRSGSLLPQLQILQKMGPSWYTWAWQGAVLE